MLKCSASWVLRLRNMDGNVTNGRLSDLVNSKSRADWTQLAEQLSKLQEQIDEGRAPHDQQQKLTLDFYEKRITNIESQIEKLRNGRNSN